MCIFSRPVISVNNTQIFARASSRDTQFLAYQMTYESHHENAMILPIPIRQPAHAESLRFIDLRGYRDFFADLAEGFPYSAPWISIGCSGPPYSVELGALEVFEVGNYIASFVPNLAELSRLDERFRLPDKTWLQIPQYEDYGFAVFQLAAGTLKPHPMAFEFENSADSLYFPTLHIHDGEVHERDEFDHVLYMQHAGFDSQVYAYENSHVPDRSTGLIRSKHPAARFCDAERAAGVVDANLLVHRRLIRGTQVNRDTEIPTSGDPTVPSLNLRPLLSYTPWLIFASAAAWFLARRSKLKHRRE